MIVESKFEDLKSIIKFDDKIIYEKDSKNPYIQSFVEDRHFIEDSFSNPQKYKFFLYLDDFSNNIIGRGACNFMLDADDICAYGKKAKELFYSVNLGGLFSDIVDPDYRCKGIHKELISYRIDYMKDKGYDHLITGILDSNLISINNYKKFNFYKIGHKKRIWEDSSHEPSGVTLLCKDL